MPRNPKPTQAALQVFGVTPLIAIPVQLKFVHPMDVASLWVEHRYVAGQQHLRTVTLVAQTMVVATPRQVAAPKF